MFDVYDNTNDNCIVIKIIYIAMLTELNFAIGYNPSIHVKHNKYFGKYNRNSLLLHLLLVF